MQSQARARQNLAKAKTAVQSGRRKDAQRFWQIAKALDPTLPFPAWMAESPQPVPPSGPRASSREELFRAIGDLPYERARPFLEDWMTRFPQDVEIRNLYREAARRADDQGQVARHEAITRPGSPRLVWRSWFKGLLVILLVGLAGWQAREAWRDWNG